MNQVLESRAARVMRRVDPELVDKFKAIIAFLDENRAFAQPPRGTTLFSEIYLEKYANSFAKGRVLQAPSEPATISDEMIKVILEEYWDLSDAQAVRAADYHNKAMGAENIIGNLLERYIASVLEPRGWVWCSGSVAKAIDFVFEDDDGEWCALQVKNRDNSENSSSKAVRDGTQILHWFRTFSKRRGDNWAAFPVSGGCELNEVGFRQYVTDYLILVKQRQGLT